jgi:phage-related protein
MKTLKDLWFIGGSRDDIKDRTLPEEVRDEFGHTLWMVQMGETPDNVSPFEGSRGNEVLKITERFDGDTYRCVYSAKFERAVYVLHVFKKKSTSGIATPRRDIATVQKRLAEAKADYEVRYGADK